MFDPVRICAFLNEEGVGHVVIGGFAAVIHGSSLPTRDLDVVPARAIGNLESLRDEIEGGTAPPAGG